MEHVAPAGSLHRTILSRVAALIAAVVLIAFIVTSGRHLWNEWSWLSDEQAQVRRSVAIGYPGITPHFSFAAKPPAWIHDEGDSTMIWGGWKDGAGHQWFRAGLGDVSPALMSNPIGRDVIQAIDIPVVERSGGVRWGRIPDEAFVVGHRLGGVETAYPLVVLGKVFVVNDTIVDHPYLVTLNPIGLQEEQVGVYESEVEGHRVTMGHSGYFYNGAPLLYDRGTESLWVDQGGALKAIAGKHKGRELRRLARPAPVSWGLWRSEHPDSRLVVGADRSRPLPEL